MLEKSFSCNQVTKETAESNTTDLLRQMFGGDLAYPHVTKSYSLQLKSGLALKSEATDLPIGDIWLADKLIKDATVMSIYSGIGALKRYPDLGTPSLDHDLEPIEGPKGPILEFHVNSVPMNDETKRKRAISFRAIDEKSFMMVSFDSDLGIKYPKSKKFKNELTISNPFDANEIGVLCIDIDGYLAITALSSGNATTICDNFQIVIAVNQLHKDGFIGVINNDKYVFAMYLDEYRYNTLKNQMENNTHTKTIVM